MLYPFTFEPIFHERIWGGRNLEHLYGKKLPPGKVIGESWEISDREEAQSIVNNGALAGRSLRWLMENHARDLLGDAEPNNGRFPLLVKILDAVDKLSLQVHPPPHKASLLGGEAKTEMWYIAHARPGAELYVGLRHGITREIFHQKIHDGSVAECFHRIVVHPGDAMFLPSGRVHAIGSGLVIFEIQQNSDTTYRVFDWNRRDPAGNPRQLHVQQSLECIDFDDIEPQAIRGKPSLVEHPLFNVDLEKISPGARINRAIESACVVAVTDGDVLIENGPGLRMGGFALIPASHRKVVLSSAAGANVLLATA